MQCISMHSGPGRRRSPWPQGASWVREEAIDTTYCNAPRCINMRCMQQVHVDATVALYSGLSGRRSSRMCCHSPAQLMPRGR